MTLVLSPLSVHMCRVNCQLSSLRSLSYQTVWKDLSGRKLTHIPGAVRLLREELQLLQEPGSYVGEVIKVRRFTDLCALPPPWLMLLTAF